MAFMSSRQRAPQTPRKVRIVLAVGQRVFVNSPATPGRPVLLTDEHGIPVAMGLHDGVEVEVLAWRPRGSAGTRYRVRDRVNGADGWLAAEELRATVIAPVPLVTEPVVSSSSNNPSGSRPFGSRY